MIIIEFGDHFHFSLTCARALLCCGITVQKFFFLFFFLNLVKPYRCHNRNFIVRYSASLNNISNLINYLRHHQFKPVDYRVLVQ